eukprot:6351924-Pyramimonas_sp.AAC.1
MRTWHFHISSPKAVEHTTLPLHKAPVLRHKLMQHADLLNDTRKISKHIKQSLAEDVVFKLITAIPPAASWVPSSCSSSSTLSPHARPSSFSFSFFLPHVLLRLWPLRRSSRSWPRNEWHLSKAGPAWARDMAAQIRRMLRHVPRGLIKPRGVPNSGGGAHVRR